jgi:Ca-activated chloride channel family protein
MSFGSPAWLVALLAIPAAVGAYLLLRRRRSPYAVRFPALASLRQAAQDVAPRTSHLPAALLLAAVAALALALARPRVAHSVPTGEGAVMLVTDHSGSMSATDVQPTRLAAAEQAADTFIAQMPASVRVGAIAFSTSPDASQSPVTDKSAARAIIDNQVAEGSTATGDALLLALQLLQGSTRTHPPSAIILLSDGAANAGVDSVTVARQAAADRIPIYTVALGTANGTLPNPDPFGPPVPVPPDPALMARIAQASGGQAFNARSAEELSSIYRRLAGGVGSVTRKQEVTAWFALGGLLLLLGAAGAGAWRAGRLP